ncbi:phosphonate transport system substrate-binding protein [Deinobacterium chartae]|uniref:Phosphonate transport system substrate-binding protein n=1 Tax=Deinobacterium chartae TaxID=521158 RepID=A0A841I1C3_9DEIO|nr:phosphate/phosphite/phosphonate ABC transporter substrate-binding protein [Deinobacterium chartae]MBB6099487.1 phosphonate transport system substrate-binding protein [Deinobacterium chartae]
MKKTLALLALGAALAGPALAAENCRVVRMGFNPAQDSNVVLTNGTAIAKYLEKSVRGVEIKTSVAQDYTGLVEAMRSGQLDFAWLSPVSYVDAAKNADAKVLLKSVRGGGPYYWAAFVVRKDSGIKTVEDLRGKNIAWIDPKSAAGYTFPRATLVSKGIDPDKFFGKQTFAGDHGAAVLSLINGTVDVVATFSNNTKGTSGSWTQLLKPEQAAKVTPVLYSKPIPGDTLSVRGTYQKGCAEVVQKITNAIAAMPLFPESKSLLTNLYRIDKMVPAKDSDYDVVRDVEKAAQKK